MQTNVDLNRNMIGKDAKIWLIERILGTKMSSRDDKALQNNIVNSGSCRNIHNNNGGFDLI